MYHIYLASRNKVHDNDNMICIEKRWKHLPKNVADPKHFSTTISQNHIAVHNFVSRTRLIIIAIQKER
jgi:hypothetical protein